MGASHHLHHHQIEFLLSVSQISSDHSQNQHFKFTLNSCNCRPSCSCCRETNSILICKDMPCEEGTGALNSNETVPGNRMEDQRPRSSPKKPSQEASPAGPTPRRSKGRFAVDDSGDLIECSGKYCRSCTAGMVADCVALCCCPCAVLHCFALAFVKAPWAVGRRCLGLGKKKKKTKRIEDDVVLERNHPRVANTRRGWVEEGMLEIVSGEMAFEAEKVWKEMYEIGHFGFFHRNSN